MEKDTIHNINEVVAKIFIYYRNMVILKYNSNYKIAKSVRQSSVIRLKIDDINADSD